MMVPLNEASRVLATPADYWVELFVLSRTLFNKEC